MGEGPLEGLLIGASLHCCGCGYELRGLPAEGPCPECGLDRLESLRHAVDPAASRLPKLSNPARVGDALVWLVACQFLIVVALTLGPAVYGIESVLGRSVPIRMPDWLILMAVGISIAALWSAIAFWTPGDEDARTIRRDLIRIGAGHIALALLMLAWWAVEYSPSMRGLGAPSYDLTRYSLLIVIAAVSIVIYTGMRGVLNTIGRRSRVFRTSQGGRQRVRDLNAALVGVMAGVGLSLLMVVFDVERWALVGRMIVAISLTMLLIGQGYLIVNAMWIRRALREPPPTLDEMLVRPSDP